MTQNTKMDVSILQPSMNTAGNTLLRQLLQCIQHGTDEVRQYLEEECDAIIECKVCRSLFRGLPNFIAHKRSYCKQRHAEVLANIQSVLGETGVAQNEAYLVVCSQPPSDDTVASEQPSQPAQSDAAPVNEPCTKTVQTLRLYDKLVSRIARQRDAPRKVLLIGATPLKVGGATQSEAGAGDKTLLQQRTASVVRVSPSDLPHSISRLQSRVESELAQERAATSSTLVSGPFTSVKAVVAAMANEKRLCNEEELPVLTAQEPSDFPFLRSRDQPPGGSSALTQFTKASVAAQLLRRDNVDRRAKVAAKTTSPTGRKLPGDSHFGAIIQVRVESKQTSSTSCKQRTTKQQSNERPKFVQLTASSKNKQKAPTDSACTNKADAAVSPSVRARLSKCRDCDVTRLQCCACVLTFENICALAAHMEQHHSAECDAPTQVEPDSGTDKPEADGRRVYPCPVCAHDQSHSECKCFASVSNVFRHLMLAHAMLREEAVALKQRIVDISYLVSEAQFEARRFPNRSPVRDGPKRAQNVRLVDEANRSVQASPVAQRSSESQNALTSDEMDRTRDARPQPKKVSKPKTTCKRTRCDASPEHGCPKVPRRNEVLTQNNNPASQRAAQNSDDLLEDSIHETADAHTSQLEEQITNQDSTDEKPTQFALPAAVSEPLTRPSNHSMSMESVKLDASPQNSNYTAEDDAASNRGTKDMTENSKGYSCSVCAAAFSRLSALKNHLARSHQLSYEQLNDNAGGSITTVEPPARSSRTKSTRRRESRKKRPTKIKKPQVVEVGDELCDELCDDGIIEQSIHSDSFSELADSLSSSEDLTSSMTTRTATPASTPTPNGEAGPPTTTTCGSGSGSGSLSIRFKLVRPAEPAVSKTETNGVSADTKNRVRDSTGRFLRQPDVALVSDPSPAPTSSGTAQRVRTKADLLAFMQAKRQSMQSALKRADDADNHAVVSLPIIDRLETPQHLEDTENSN